MGRGREDLRRGPGLPPPRPVGGDRARATTRSGSWACRSSPKQAERSSASTCSTRRSSCPRSSCRSSASGKMVLDRNPDNFFAETEQVAFCIANIVPGIDFTNDPLLQGRLFSYLDTQLTRLGGPNFHEIPINSPVAQVHNNQRDGMHRQAIPRGRVAYEPNSLGGGCPFQAGGAASRRSPSPSRPTRSASEAREVRRALQPGAHVLEQPDAGREGAHRRGVPLRARQGRAPRDPRARRRPCHHIDEAFAGRGRRPRRRVGCRSPCRRLNRPSRPRWKQAAACRPRRPRSSLANQARPRFEPRKVALLALPGVAASDGDAAGDGQVDLAALWSAAVRASRSCRRRSGR